MVSGQWLIKATSYGSDKSARMRRLVWDFVGRTYYIVGNLMSRLMYVLKDGHSVYVWTLSLMRSRDKPKAIVFFRDNQFFYLKRIILLFAEAEKPFWQRWNPTPYVVCPPLVWRKVNHTVKLFMAVRSIFTWNEIIPFSSSRSLYQLRTKTGSHKIAFDK